MCVDSTTRGGKMNAKPSIITMYAISPCHAGSGTSIGTVDLPIQRERHTNWPLIASSGVKGAMRAQFDKLKSSIKNDSEKLQVEDLTEKVFGTDRDKSNEENGGYAGSVIVSDAKILAFPMRSNIAPFVWITCPSVLNRLSKDIVLAEKEVKIECVAGIEEENAIILKGDVSEEKVLLEDIEVTIDTSSDSIREKLSPILKYLEQANRLLLVSDKVFDYCVSYCTSITAQIQIDQTTGTTKNGSLRYQEELPSDTIMYCVIFWRNSYKPKAELLSETIKCWIKENIMNRYIQIGGDETCGRGIFELNWNEED